MKNSLKYCSALYLFVITTHFSTNSLGQVASDDVPESLEDKARILSEQHQEFMEINDKSKTVYVGIEKLRLKTTDGNDDKRDTYLVTHYVYDTDAAIKTTVNLSDGSVLNQQVLPHLPTNLSEQELEEATSLALSDKRVREVIGSYINNVETEALMVRTTDESDPLFGKRVVRLLFKVGRDYLSKPEVMVNLTEGEVLLSSKGSR